MGNRLPNGLGMSAHWIDMVGADKGQVKYQDSRY